MKGDWYIIYVRTIGLKFMVHVGKCAIPAGMSIGTWHMD